MRSGNKNWEEEIAHSRRIEEKSREIRKNWREDK
jgi:hypothetical protein